MSFITTKYTLMNTDSLTVPCHIDIMSGHTGSMVITGQISHVQRQSGYSRKAFECNHSIIYVMTHAFFYNTDMQACDQMLLNPFFFPPPNTNSVNVLWNLKRGAATFIKPISIYVPTWLHFCMVVKADYGLKKKKRIPYAALYYYFSASVNTL